MFFCAKGAIFATCMKTENDAKSPRIVRIPAMRDCRGTLCVADYESANLPFVPRRTFWITDVPEGQERGYHAHRTCDELLFAIRGSLKVDLTDSDGTRTFQLECPDEGLLIPAMCWCRLHGFSADAVCVCLASESYDESGYINDIETFKANL